jgi:hypothetical protein
MKTIQCPQCSLVNFSTALACKRCGYFFQKLETVEPVAPSFPSFNQPAPPMPYPAENYSQPNYQPSNYQSYQSSKSLKKGLAVFSMLLGILSFPMINLFIGAILSVFGAALFGVGGAIAVFAITLLFLPTGLMTGIVSLVKANKRPNEYGGKGFAISGIVLSGFALVVTPLIATIAIPNLLAARRSANEGSAIASLRTIANAQVDFAVTKYRCGDLNELGAGGMIDAELAKGTKGGYVFMIARTVSGCEIMAKPVTAEGFSASGSRSFYFSTEEGILRASVNIKNFADKQAAPVEVSGFPSAQTFSAPKLNVPNEVLPIVTPEAEKIDYSTR